MLYVEQNLTEPDSYPHLSDLAFLQQLDVTGWKWLERRLQAPQPADDTIQIAQHLKTAPSDQWLSHQEKETSGSRIHQIEYTFIF